MTSFLCASVLAGALLFSAPVGSAQSASSRPSADGWDPTWFDYDQSLALVVEEATPTAAQIDFKARPPQVPANEPTPRRSERAAAPLAVGPLNIVHLRFTDADGEIVPALLCTPRNRKGPFPLVVAVHGLTSNKAQVCAQIAPALARQGFAVLAADMPRHGERRGDPRSVLDRSNPIKSFQLFRQAVIDVRLCMDLAESRPDIDMTHGVILCGYSMGSWIDAIAGPADTRVKAMVLMVGGAADTPAAALLIPQIAATDPRLALSHFAGPLLMLNAKSDPIVTPDMARRLFAAASQPKQQTWYEGGHLLSPSAYEDAAKWIGRTARDLNRDGAKPQRKAG